MKKTLALLLAFSIIMCCFASCSKETDNDDVNESGNIETKAETELETEVEETTIADIDEPWGVVDTVYVEDSSYNIVKACINMPELLTISRGPGQVAYQNDDTLVLLGGQSADDTLEINSPNEALDAFAHKYNKVLDTYRPYDFEEFAFDIEETEMLTINGYEMCKYTGVHTYTNDGVAGSMNFVAYTTALKGNGAYMYWIVLDETDDQSLRDLIVEHADNMAKSLYEE